MTVARRVAARLKARSVGARRVPLRFIGGLGGWW